MTKYKLLGTAALVLASVLAGPSMAQQRVDNPGQTRTMRPASHNSSYQHRAHRHVAVRSRGDRWDRRDSGFWPGDVAADAVDGAAATAGAVIGTAGAIATAPFGRDSYAYDNGDQGWYARDYARRNGFVCQPGSMFRGEDGRPHLCQ